MQKQLYSNYIVNKHKNNCIAIIQLIYAKTIMAII